MLDVVNDSSLLLSCFAWEADVFIWYLCWVLMLKCKQHVEKSFWSFKIMNNDTCCRVPVVAENLWRKTELSCFWWLPRNVLKIFQLYHVKLNRTGRFLSQQKIVICNILQSQLKCSCVISVIKGTLNDLILRKYLLDWSKGYVPDIRETRRPSTPAGIVFSETLLLLGSCSVWYGSPRRVRLRNKIVTGHKTAANGNRSALVFDNFLACWSTFPRLRFAKHKNQA